MKPFLLFKRSICSFLRVCILGIAIICLNTSIAFSHSNFTINIINSNGTPELTTSGKTDNYITTHVAYGNVPGSVSRTITVDECLLTLQDFIFFSSTGAVSNTGNSKVTGDVGSNLGSVSGFDAPTILNGGIYSAEPKTIQAKKDLLKLYIHLSDIPITNTTHEAVFGSDKTIYAGVYTIPGAGSMAGNLNIDAEGISDAVFIIKFEGAFSPATSSSISLKNGAKASNVYWIAEGAISIGASALMKGTFIAHTGAVSMAAGGNLEGRLFSTVGAVSFGPGMAILPSTSGYLPDLSVSSCNNDILNSAGNFTLFTSAGAVSNIGSSGIIGDVGSNAGAITGFETSATTLMGNTNNADLVTAKAATELLAGYTKLVNITATNSAHAPAFGNETLAPGVYAIAGAGSLAGTLTLDGTPPSGATTNQIPTFIFKFGGAFSVGAQSKIILKNVSHCNVYWVAEGAISIGAFSFMKGAFISNNGAVTMGANGNLEGNLFSTTGAIGFNTGVGYISYSLCTSPSNNGTKIANTAMLTSKIAISADNKLSVYPNPARGIIKMAFTGDASKVTSVEILDVLGKLVYSSKHFQSIINLSNKTAGVYFVRVHLNAAITTTKIVIEK